MAMSTAVALLVDDEVPFVETMTKRLSKRNMTVFTAFSGSEALRYWKSSRTSILSFSM
jgi:ActR/RegA family two-component response regulator